MRIARKVTWLTGLILLVVATAAARVDAQERTRTDTSPPTAEKDRTLLPESAKDDQSMTPENANDDRTAAPESANDREAAARPARPKPNVPSTAAPAPR